jgi:peptidoglycan hydrolase-like protein with peptidoglycan-binding domain
MFQHVSRRLRPFAKSTTPLKLVAGATAAAVLIGWVAGVCAQTTGEPIPPPLPPPVQQAAPQQAGAPATNSTSNFPALPLGQDGVREVQSQLIALGFDPGPVDGETGPATVAAAQQYNENRGGSGPVPVDGVLLTRLQQDTGPRLPPEEVAARSQPRYQAQAPAANPLAGVMQQFEQNLHTLFNGGY